MEKVFSYAIKHLERSIVSKENFMSPKFVKPNSDSYERHEVALNEMREELERVKGLQKSFGGVFLK